MSWPVRGLEKKNPIWGIFQALFVEVMNSLPDNKALLLHKGKQNFFRAFRVCCVVDFVARASTQGMNQYNAYCGCNRCLQTGDNVSAHAVAREILYLARGVCFQ